MSNTIHHYNSEEQIQICKKFPVCLHGEYNILV